MAAVNEPAPSRRTGRPPRVDLDRIAQAAAEIGFADVTMKNVADSLGMSVPGLYYYVRGRSDLLRLAAAYHMSRTPLPVDEGQRWSDWLREWARYMRDAMAERELLDHYIDGELDDGRMVEVIRLALDVLRREGLAPEQAVEAWDAISSLAVGSAVAELRRREAAAAGRPHGARSAESADDAFERRVTMLLVGMATSFGLPTDDV